MLLFSLFVFPIWVFLHKHLRFIGQQGKEEVISLSPLYHFQPLHRHSDMRRAITAGSSPLRIASSQTRTGKLWFQSASHSPLGYVPFILLIVIMYTNFGNISFNW